MEQGYLIDTNAVIDYLDNKLSKEMNQLVDSVESRISVITRMELLAWSGSTEAQTAILQSFINTSVVYQLEESTILKAIEIRKQFKVKLPDAIIAATALVNGLVLITSNSKDFKNIPELLIINPHFS